jgi:hypothetical protein
VVGKGKLHEGPHGNPMSTQDHGGSLKESAGIPMIVGFSTSVMSHIPPGMPKTSSYLFLTGGDGAGMDIQKKQTALIALVADVLIRNRRQSSTAGQCFPHVVEWQAEISSCKLGRQRCFDAFCCIK